MICVRLQGMGAPLPPGVTFVGRWGLGATRGDPTFPTLREIMRELGHARLDVLKLDIEGDEWDALLGDVLCPARGAAGLGHAPFGQLLVELHLRDGTTDIDRIAPLFARLEAHGFRTFHREPNVLDVQQDAPSDAFALHAAALVSAAQRTR